MNGLKLKERRNLILLALCVLVVGVILVSRDSDDHPAESQVESPAAESAEGLPELRKRERHPVKEALRNSAWEIVVRRAEGVSASDSENGVRLSLQFVRANFNRAGMRGVHRFAAFSPPQFEAIKNAYEKLSDTRISVTPDEIVPSGGTVGFELQDPASGREFTVDLAPTIGRDGSSIRLETVTGGTQRRRDGNLPIWDGQTVMIALSKSTDPRDRRQLAAFVTVRIVDTGGEPVNEFVVK